MNCVQLLRELGLNRNLRIKDYYGSGLHAGNSVDDKRLKFLNDNFVKIKDGDVVVVLSLHNPTKRTKIHRLK